MSIEIKAYKDVRTGTWTVEANGLVLMECMSEEEVGNLNISEIYKIWLNG